MNLRAIKLECRKFLNKFDRKDFTMVMQYLELLLDDYNTNPDKIMNGISFLLLFSKIIQNFIFIFI
jgi:hypothetical protein